ncbi:hypothetical protein [Cellulomonas fimi]|uniref:hypothetical protein n=1 Tax=Cellulomonas fimi TaxID=1708 RepID=UPI00235830FF|nr:hypothetical protein [Cellulomonas fimi]
MRRSKAVLRARVEDGTTYDDPSEDALFLLFEDIESGDGTWLVVENLTDRSHQTYAQCARQDDGSYEVEHRAGSADRHFTTTVLDFRAAHEVVTAWAFDLPGWQDLPWERLEL